MAGMNVRQVFVGGLCVYGLLSTVLMFFWSSPSTGPHMATAHTRLLYTPNITPQVAIRSNAPLLPPQQTAYVTTPPRFDASVKNVSNKQSNQTAFNFIQTEQHEKPPIHPINNLRFIREVNLMQVHDSARTEGGRQRPVGNLNNYKQAAGHLTLSNLTARAEATWQKVDKRFVYARRGVARSPPGWGSRRRWRGAEQTSKPNTTSEILNYEEAIALLSTTAHNATATRPLPYAAEYRNPCWWEKNGAIYRIRCLPYFFLAGFPKCGTTDLHQQLTFHPHIIRTSKELHYWNIEVIKKPLSSYLEKFERATENLKRLCDSRHNSNNTKATTCQAVFGDATPGTIWNNDAWRDMPGNAHLKEPRYLVADLLHHFLPQARLIVLLRNPVERAYSQYMYSAVDGDPEQFHQAVILAINGFQQCLEEHSLKYCVCDDSLDEQTDMIRLRAGIYYAHLHGWYTAGHQRAYIHIILFENYIQDRQTTVNQVFTFLQLEAVSWADRSRAALNHRSDQARRKGPMLPETRHLLQNFYRPYNTKVLTMIHERTDFWGY